MAYIEPKIREILLKIRELTNSPIFGESAAANRKLQHFLAKYKLTLEDLEDGVGERYFKFGYWNNVQRDLLHAICTKVMRTNEIKWIRLQSSCQIEMTPQQYAIIDASYNYYCSIYDREVKAFFDAFCNKHNLFNPELEAGDPESESHGAKVRGFMSVLDEAHDPASTLRG